MILCCRKLWPSGRPVERQQAFFRLCLLPVHRLLVTDAAGTATAWQVGGVTEAGQTVELPAGVGPRWLTAQCSGQAEVLGPQLLTSYSLSPGSAASLSPLQVSCTGSSGQS